MKPLSIYIHIPFCERKCAYCDFVSFDNRADTIDRYVDALCVELKSANIEKAETIFIGGGTPSILSISQISKIFESLPKASEVTIESNPNSITEEKLRHWLSLGINRLSIGVQSFDDAVLKTLGRIHNSEQAMKAIELAYRCGFRNINIDLMHSVTNAAFTIPQQIFKYVTHVSAYSLIIEPGTAFAKSHKPINESESIRQQKQIEITLGVHGFSKYEVSNFALEGYKCRHNLAYWKPQTNEYLGFGLAAHSFYNNTRFSNTTDLDSYLKGATLDERSKQVCTPEDTMVETIMLGLRTTVGVDVAILLNKSAEIRMLKDLKLLKEENGRIIATHKGFLLLNQIIEKLT